MGTFIPLGNYMHDSVRKWCLCVWAWEIYQMRVSHAKCVRVGRSEIAKKNFCSAKKWGGWSQSLSSRPSSRRSFNGEREGNGVKRLRTSLSFTWPLDSSCFVQWRTCSFPVLACKIVIYWINYGIFLKKQQDSSFLSLQRCFQHPTVR